MSWILNEPPRPSRPSPEPPPGEPGATAAPALPDLPPEPEAGVAPPEMASPSTAPAAPTARKRGPDFRLGNRRRGGWWRVLLRLGLAGLGGLVTAGAMAAGILYTSLAHDLPRLDTFDKMVARAGSPASRRPTAAWPASSTASAAWRCGGPTCRGRSSWPSWPPRTSASSTTRASISAASCAPW
ncbi:MAG: hypothetical protein U1F43_18415 [Myxococcota bacterium]